MVWKVGLYCLIMTLRAGMSLFMTKISFTSIANLAHFSTLDNKTVFVMYCFERVMPISMYWQSEFGITSMQLYCTLFALFQMKK